MPLTGVLRAGVTYGLALFALGFAMGTLRVLVVAPRVGPEIAVLLELPVMLLGAWVLVRWVLRRAGVPRRVDLRLVMGGAAFAVLMACEAALAVMVFDTPLPRHLARYLDPGAWPGLAAQLCVIAMPALALKGR